MDRYLTLYCDQRELTDKLNARASEGYKVLHCYEPTYLTGGRVMMRVLLVRVVGE